MSAMVAAGGWRALAERSVHLHAPLPVLLQLLQELLPLHALALGHALEHVLDPGHHALEAAEIDGGLRTRAPVRHSICRTNSAPDPVPAIKLWPFSHAVQIVATPNHVLRRLRDGI